MSRHVAAPVARDRGVPRRRRRRSRHDSGCPSKHSGSRRLGSVLTPAARLRAGGGHERCGHAADHRRRPHRHALRRLRRRARREQSTVDRSGVPAVRNRVVRARFLRSTPPLGATGAALAPTAANARRGEDRAICRAGVLFSRVDFVRGDPDRELAVPISIRAAQRATPRNLGRCGPQWRVPFRLRRREPSGATAYSVQLRLLRAFADGSYRVRVTIR